MRGSVAPIAAPPDPALLLRQGSHGTGRTHVPASRTTAGALGSPSDHPAADLPHETLLPREDRAGSADQPAPVNCCHELKPNLRKSGTRVHNAVVVNVVLIIRTEIVASLLLKPASVCERLRLRAVCAPSAARHSPDRRILERGRQPILFPANAAGAVARRRPLGFPLLRPTQSSGGVDSRFQMPRCVARRRWAWCLVAPPGKPGVDVCGAVPCSFKRCRGTVLR